MSRKHLGGMPTPPSNIADWNGEEDLLNYFLAGGDTGVTPPLPAGYNSTGLPVMHSAGGINSANSLNPSLPSYARNPGPVPRNTQYQQPNSQYQPNRVSFNQAVNSNVNANAATKPVDMLPRGSSVLDNLDNFDTYDPSSDEDNAPSKTPVNPAWGGSLGGRKGSAIRQAGSLPNPTVADNLEESFTPGTEQFIRESFIPEIQQQGQRQGQQQHVQWISSLNNSLNTSLNGHTGSYTGPAEHRPIPSQMPQLAADGMPILPNFSQFESAALATSAPPSFQHGGPNPGIPNTAPYPAPYSAASFAGPGSAEAYPSSSYATGSSPPSALPLAQQTPDERRARRLARNRESARQSRRRKKEYLALLGEKAKLLADEMDVIRRSHLTVCESELATVRGRWIDEMRRGGEAGMSLKHMWDATGELQVEWDEEGEEAEANEGANTCRNILRQHAKTHMPCTLAKQYA